MEESYYRKHYTPTELRRQGKLRGIDRYTVMNRDQLCSALARRDRLDAETAKVIKGPVLRLDGQLSYHHATMLSPRDSSTVPEHAKRITELRELAEKHGMVLQRGEWTNRCNTYVFKPTEAFLRDFVKCDSATVLHSTLILGGRIYREALGIGPSVELGSADYIGDYARDAVKLGLDLADRSDVTPLPVVEPPAPPRVPTLDEQLLERVRRLKGSHAIVESPSSPGTFSWRYHPNSSAGYQSILGYPTPEAASYALLSYLDRRDEQARAIRTVELLEKELERHAVLVPKRPDPDF